MVARAEVAGRRRHAGPSSWSGRDTLIAAIVVALTGIASLSWIYGTRPHLSVIRSDGVGYYMYLPQIILRHDPAFRTIGRETPQRRADLRVRRDPVTGRYVELYQVGEAVLLLPFFAGAHVAAVVTGAPRTGVSPPYQAGVAAAGLVFLVVGVVFLSRLLASLFSRRTVGFTLVAVVFGTILFHYGTFENSFSHIYSFAVYSIVLVAVRWWTRSPSAGSSAVVGALCGLFVLIRLTNVILLLAALAFVLYELRAIGARSALRSHRWDIGIAGVSAAAVFSPQSILWKLETGHWFVDSYRYSGVGFDFLHPHVLDALFSVRKGLFFWSPLLLLCCVGLVSLRRYDRGLAYGAAVAVPINAYVISSWREWAYGLALGQRAFVETFPLFALGFAALVESSTGARRRVVLGVSAVLVALSILVMVRYWQHLVPEDRATWHSFVRALLGQK